MLKSKTREYKLTYALLVHLDDKKKATGGKDDIKYIIKLFKAHHSVLDADYGFISSP